MRNKMKVINMELLNLNHSAIIDDLYEKTNSQFQQVALRFLQVLRNDNTADKLQAIKELITEQRLPFLTKAINFFIKRNQKSEQDEQRHKNQYQTEKALKQNIEKVTRKLSEALAYIEHIKMRLTSKESDLAKKEQTILVLKKQCQIWKEKSQKSQIMKDWSDSSLLLKNLQVTISPYPRPEEIQVNYEAGMLNKQNENIFQRTSYQISRKNHQLKRRKICTSSTEHKLKKRQEKRQFRKSSDPFKFNALKQKGGQCAIENGLVIGQKQLNQVQNKKSVSER